jgi:hypothetical protein
MTSIDFAIIMLLINNNKAELVFRLLYNNNFRIYNNKIFDKYIFWHNRERTFFIYFWKI